MKKVLLAGLCSLSLLAAFAINAAPKDAMTVAGSSMAVKVRV